LAAESKKLAASKAAAADEGTKEGDTKEGADGTLVLKDGHWVKQGEQAAAATAGGLSVPEFAPSKDGETKYAEHYAKVAKKIKEHAEAGNVQVLEDMKADGLTPKNGKVGNTWKGKTANSKTLMAFYDAALAHAKGNEPAMESAPADIPAPDTELPKAVSDALLAHPDGMGPKTWDSVAKHASNGDADALKKLQAVDGIIPEVKDWIGNVLIAMGAKPAAEPTGGLFDDINAAAEKGDMQTLKDIAAYAAKNGMQKTAEHAAKKIGELATKMTADSAPSLPVLDTADMSDLHKDAAKAIHDLTTKGSAVGHVGGQVSNLQDYYSAFDYAGNNLDDKKIAAYAKDALASLGEEAKHIGSADQSVMPEPSAGVDEGTAKTLKKWATTQGAEGIEKLKNFAKVDAGTQQDAEEQYASALAEWAEKQPGAADSGPKEGDTKQGADGMLVFKDGRWHKQGGDEPKATDPKELVKKVASVAKPKFEGKNSVKMNKTVKALQAIALKDGDAGLDKAIYDSKPNGHKVMIDAGDDGKWGIWKEGAPGNASENGKALAAYALALKAAMAGTTGVGEAAAATAPKKAASKVVGTTKTETESVDGWKQVGPQGGYNPGGTFEDASGQKWYVKFPAGGEKIVKNELLATKLYALAGVEVPEVKVVNQGGKIGLASKIIDGAVANKSALLEGKAPGLLSGFAADAWLANWDTVGNNPAAGKGFDNILFKPDGSAVRIDAGGALLYGGAGGKKQTFENEVTDLKTMLDPAKNANTAAVFGKMSAADITASVAKIANIPDHEIEGLVMEFGPGSASEKTRLAAKLIARKHNMSEQYPTAKAKKEAGAQGDKAKPDPRNLKINPALVPPMHDFMNWGGSGKPISDKPYVQHNIKAEQDILDFALKGDLIALKKYQFQPVDKLTGEAVGDKKPIGEHGSNHVKQYYDSVVSYLDTVANPPEPMRNFTAKKASTLASLSALFKPHDYGVSIADVKASERLGFWIALGVADSPEKFRPKTVGMKLTEAAKKAAYDAFKKLPETVTTFIKAVQGSGSNNQPYRDGKETDNQGQKTRTVLDDLYKTAVSHKEGTTINKWIEMSDEMVSQFLDNPEGLVFQNPGSMCTSQHDTATSGFGKHRVVIHYAEGAAATDTFGSGGFSGEAEITTLPGARFMVLSRKMVADVEHGSSKKAPRLELEVLMLPPDPTYVDNLTKVNK
jgi:hypothetical protein